MPLPNRIGALSALALLACGSVLAGCGVPPELQPTPGAPVPSSTSSPTPPGLPPGFTMSPSLRPPSPAAFPETTAVPCADKPSEAQIIAVTRGRFPIGSGAKASLGPLCAGTWQYTVLNVAGREPLQVVTSGEPTSLKLVSAGTDICTVEVRNYAPAGILLAARC